MTAAHTARKGPLSASQHASQHASGQSSRRAKSHRQILILAPLPANTRAITRANTAHFNICIAFK